MLALRRVTNFFDLKKQFLSLRGKILNEMVSVCDDQAFILAAKVEKLEQAITTLAERALLSEFPPGPMRNF
jgi:hypothetical protein